MSRPGMEFVDDVEIVVRVDLVGRQDAIFTVDFEDGDRDHQVTGKLESVGLCEREIVRHRSGSIRERANPARWLRKGPGAGAITATAQPKRPQRASGPFTG